MLTVTDYLPTTAQTRSDSSSEVDRCHRNCHKLDSTPAQKCLQVYFTPVMTSQPLTGAPHTNTGGWRTERKEVVVIYIVNRK